MALVAASLTARRMSSRSRSGITPRRPARTDCRKSPRWAGEAGNDISTSDSLRQRLVRLTYPRKGGSRPWSPGGPVAGAADELPVDADQELSLLLVEPGVALDRVDHGQRPQRDRRRVHRRSEAEIAGQRSRRQPQRPLQREDMVVARRGRAPLPLRHRGLAHADELGQGALTDPALLPRRGELTAELGALHEGEYKTP